MKRLLLVLAISFFGLGTASACLNDSVIIEAEEEFQQQYDVVEEPIGPVNIAATQPEAGINLPTIMAGVGMIAGLVMVAVALGMVMTRPHAGPGQ